MRFFFKSCISLILVVFLTLGFFPSSQPPPIKEGMTFPNIGEVIKNGFKDVFDPIKDFFTKTFGALIGDILGIVDEVEDFFKTIPNRVGDVNNGFNKIGEGLKMEFDHLGVALKTGFGDIFTFVGLFKYVFSYLNDFFKTYIGSRVSCGMDKIYKFRDCFMYYFFDLFGYTFYYVCVELPVWIVLLITGHDMQPGIDMIANMATYVDDFMFEMLGFHIFSYSQTILDECYMCKNLQDMPDFPIKPFHQQIQKINVDWKHAIPDYLNQPKSVFVDAGKHFKSAFNAHPGYKNKKTSQQLPSMTEIQRSYGLDV